MPRLRAQPEQCFDTCTPVQYHGGAPIIKLDRTPVVSMDTSYDWLYNVTMKILPAAKFKEQCLALLDEVDPDGILVTKRGKPVAKLIPVARGGKALLGSLLERS